MNVLLVTNLYPPNAIGGYERLCASVASGLLARGHSVSVLTSDWGELAPQGDDVAVERSLKLFVSGKSIYEPFNGSALERRAISRRTSRGSPRRSSGRGPRWCWRGTSTSSTPRSRRR